MKPLRYLAGRLPWVALGVVLGAAGVWAVLRTAEREPAPEAPAATDPQVKYPDQWWGDDKTVRINPAAPYSGDVQLSADGRRLLVGWGRGLRVWDLSTGRSVGLHADANSAVMYPSFSPDGRWVAGLRGAEPEWELIVWDAATGTEAGVEPKTKREPGNFRHQLLGFDGGGGAWVVRPAGVAERVEVPSGWVTRSVKLPFGTAAWGRVVLSAGGRWLALGGGTTFAVRSTEAAADWLVVERHPEPEPSYDLPQPTTCPVPVGFSPDDRRLVTYDRKGGVVAVWELGEKPAKVASRTADLTPWTHLTDLTFTPDGTRFGFVSTPRPQDRTAPELMVWDAATLTEVARVASPAGVDGFAFTPDGQRVVLTHADGTLTVRELSAGN